MTKIQALQQLLLVAAPLTAIAGNATTNLRQTQGRRERQLQYHTPECDDAGASEGAQCYNLIKYKLEWPECLNMNVKDCEKHIKNQISSTQHALITTNDMGTNIHIHLPDAPETAPDGEVVIDVVAPQPPSAESTEVKKNYYYRFDMPVNYAGQPVGYRIDGDMHFPGKWTYTCSSSYGHFPTSTGSSGSTCTAEDMTWTCKGAENAAQCENEVMQQMGADDIATRDKQGNFMTPWVRQVSPTPYHNSGSEYFKDTSDHYGFCAWEFDYSLGKYKARALSASEMLSPLNESKSKASTMKSEVEGLLNSGASKITRSAAVNLVRNCHTHLRTSPDAGVYCTEVNHYVKQYSPHDVPIANDGLKPHLVALLEELNRFLSLPVRMEYHIEIHGADSNGNQVSQVPKIGHHYSHDAPVCVPGATHG